MAKMKRKNIKFRYIGGALIVVILMLGFYFRKSIGLAGGAEEYPLSWFIIICAVLGSLVNQSYRQDELVKPTIGTITGYLFWKGTVAIVFAFVLYFALMGELISGDMFPHFVRTSLNQGGDYVSMKEFATKVDPVSYKDVAKILVWSFIAGYSEQFVPNLISKISKSGK